MYWKCLLRSLKHYEFPNPIDIMYSCSRVTSKKDPVFECAKYKKLVHYACTRLPAYTVYLLKSSKRQYEACVGTPIEFIKLFDPDESDENNKIEEQLEDIRVDIKKKLRMELQKFKESSPQIATCI